MTKKNEFSYFPQFFHALLGTVVILIVIILELTNYYTVLEMDLQDTSGTLLKIQYCYTVAFIVGLVIAGLLLVVAKTHDKATKLNIGLIVPMILYCIAGLILIWVQPNLIFSTSAITSYGATAFNVMFLIMTYLFPSFIYFLVKH